MKSIQKALLCSASALAFCTMLSAAAYADEAIETVVVTGEKVSENLQKAPVSVTVVTSKNMISANVSDFTDLAKFAPSLTMTKGDHPGNSAAVIRGVGTFAFSVAVNPSVLVVVDDVAVGYQAQAFADLVDIDHVEVLSGPQSTLYGKSASAGLIAITTKAPTDTFTYFGDAKMTNDGEVRTALSLSGPISDTVDYRLNGSYRHYDGNVINLFTDKKVNDDTTLTGSGKVEWRPSEKFDAVFAVHFLQDMSACCAVPYTRIDPGTGAAPLYFGKAGKTFAVVAAGVTPSPTNRNIALTQSPIANSQEYGFSAHVSYDLGNNMSLVSITSFDHYKMHDLTDYDGTDIDMMALFTPCYAFGSGLTPLCNNATATNTATAQQLTTVHGAILQGGAFNVQTLAQELRLSSQGNSTFNWVVGLYVDSEDDVRVFARGFQIYGSALVPNAKSDTSWRGEAQYQNYALFGQSQWEFTPGTTLITGLRLNREHSQYSYVDYYRPVSFPTVNTNPLITDPPLGAALPADYMDDVWTGKIGLQEQFTDDFMGFATVSRGYKGVGYNLTSNLSATEASNFPVKRETSIDYEVGARTGWFDGRFILNATAFWMDYSNFQISSLAPSPPNPVNTFILTNIPSVRTRGVEIASTAAITDDLSANLNYAYTEATATDFPNGGCYGGQKLLSTAPATCSIGAGTQNLTGQTLPNAPKNKISAFVNWKVLQQEPVTLVINATTVWQSKVNFTLNADPGTVQGAYNITNLNFTFGLKSDSRFSLSLYVNNLFDQHYDANVANVTSNFTWTGQPVGTSPQAMTHQVPRDYSRYFGIRFAVSNQ